MARERMFDPGFHKFFTEAINKENKIRIQWHSEHDNDMRHGVSCCSWDDEPDNFVWKVDASEDVYSGFQPKKHGEKISFGARERSLLKELAESNKVKYPALMRLMPVATRRLLYGDESYLGEGRSNYLKARNKMSPESKYYFPICTSWDYGWMNGQEQELLCPQYGRGHIM